MNRLTRGFPAVALAVALAYLVAGMLPERDPEGGMHLREFGRVPAVYQGRCKPLDTLARNSLMVISDRQTFVDTEGTRQPAIRWLLDLMTSTLDETPAAHAQAVFRIDNDQVLSILGLPERPGFRYSLDELKPKLELVQRHAARAGEREAAQRDLVDNRVLELYRQLQLFLTLAHFEEPHLVPPRGGTEDWKPFAAVAHAESASGKENPDARALGTMLLAYAENRPAVFNSELARYAADLDSRMPDITFKARFETFFNRFEPFYRTSVLYLVALLLACLGWMGWTEMFHKTAYRLLWLTLVVHTFALLCRIYLQGRPPVTNLYSSAVFIGWGCVIGGLVLERIYRVGVGTFLAALLGFGAQVISHNLSGDGDTMEMMQAVLDTNFWLATHVTVVTLGYSATFVAGFLGLLYVTRGVFTRSLDATASRTLASMMYGVIAFATLFSFTGTVLGGIWADQSWGRFWGWDPKENGALIIVLWNALILHARWGGMIRDRGVALLSIFGNVVTAWSWFGVNMLGIGLHSYGFMGSAAFWLIAFVGSQLAWIGLGTLPLRWWRSGSSLGAAAAAPAPVESEETLSGAAR